MKEPLADRPYIAHKEYGIPEDLDRLIEWGSIAERFRRERNYWIATTSDNGSPLARPVWGVFVDDTICFGGGPQTRWSRNLTRDPRTSVHLESGTEVVIAEGTLERLTEADDPRLSAIDDAYEEKYEMRHGPPIWLLRPNVVLAWTDFPKDATRFRFSDNRT